MNKHSLFSIQKAQSTLSVVLAFTMLFNLVAPAAAQTASRPPRRDVLNNLDKELRRATTAPQDNTRMVNMERKAYLMNENRKVYIGALTEADQRRLGEIVQILYKQPDGKTPSDFDIFNEGFQASLTENVAAQQKEINQEYDKQLRAINARAAEFADEYTPESIETWKKQSTDELTAWKEQSLAALTSWKKEQSKNSKKIFEKNIQQKMLQEREAVVKDIVRDLFALQKKGSSWATDVLLETAVVLLPMRTLDNKSFFTQEQQAFLEKQYIAVLNASKKTDLCTTEGARCSKAFAALTGLGMVGRSQNAGAAVSDFIVAHSKSELAAPALLNGMASLLGMKNYGAIRGIIHEATFKERMLGQMDMLSVTEWVNALANINGQYLGEISKYAQYPVDKNANEHSAMNNAWEDVALLLAEEGSTDSLAILRKYGVEQCLAYKDTGLNMKDNLKMKCSGILPFLVGALKSGKSGIANYAPKMKEEQPGSYISNSGTRVVTPAQAAAGRQHNQSLIDTFRAYVQKTGLTAEAAIAQYLFVQSMGDLNAETELALDTALAKVYNKTAQHPKPGYAVSAYTSNSAQYKAKASRQQRTRFFRKAAVWADIAILLWCAYDITKWVRNGYKIAQGVMGASKMARNGASVAQRAVMLRKLNITSQMRSFVNIPKKIRNGMEPVVLANLHHFTNPVRMPAIPGAVESMGTLVAKGATFSAETGMLAVNARELTAAAGGQVNLQTSSALSAALGNASAEANTAFANRSFWQKALTFNKDSSYRAYLSEAVSRTQLPGISRAETVQFAAQVKNMPGITVPANIEAFKAPQLFANSTLQEGALSRVMTTALGHTPQAAQVSHTAQLLRTAQQDANLQFAQRGWFSRGWSWLTGKSNQQYKGMLLNNLAASFDADGLLFTQPEQYKLYRSLVTTLTNDMTIQAPSAAVLSPLKGQTYKAAKTSYKKMGSAILYASDPAVLPQALPLNVFMDKGISGVEGAGSYQRVLFTDSGRSFLFGFGNNLAKPFKPGSFKITLADTDMPLFIRAAENTPGLTAPFEIKLTPMKNNGLRGMFTSKNTMYAQQVPVFVRQADGALAAAPVVFKAHSRLKFSSVQAVLEADGQMSWLRNGALMADVPQFRFGIPKNGLRTFLNVAENASQPLNLYVKSSRNKITPLMWATGLSLSSASSSLIPSLETNYKDNITETDKTLISLALPYIPSLFAPALTPVVMKFGALRTLQGALAVSTAGLAFTAFNGFYGSIGTKGADGTVDPNSLPSIWPLYVSGTAIGVSSALSRASLNLLIDRMGGGASLLKSMAFKNIGSFSLLAPQLIVGLSGWKPDFSFAFPVTGLLSAGALTWVSSSRIDTNIGRVAGFMKWTKPQWELSLKPLKTVTSNIGHMFKEGFAETASSFRMLGLKELALPTLAATAFTGFEASTFNKATSQLIRPHVEESGFISGFSDSTDRKNLTALITSGTMVLFPLMTRLKAKSLLDRFADPLRPTMEYQRMLKLSYALNIGGTGLLMYYGFDGNILSPGFAGMAMVGVGTANMTQSLQKLSNYNVAHSAYVLSKTAGMDAAAAAAFRQKTVTQAMTSFPVSQLGLAGLPLLVSHYTDQQIKDGIETKQTAPRTSLWIPMLSIGASLTFAAPLITRGLRIPAGLVGGSKGLFGSYPGTFNNLQYGNPQEVVSRFPQVPTVTAPVQDATAEQSEQVQEVK